jgi:hypothetical protein
VEILLFGFPPLSTLRHFHRHALSYFRKPCPQILLQSPKRDFQSKTLLRIKIRHGRGLAQPADKPEENALKEVQEQLQGLGLGSANGG